MKDKKVLLFFHLRLLRLPFIHLYTKKKMSAEPKKKEVMLKRRDFFISSSFSVMPVNCGKYFVPRQRKSHILICKIVAESYEKQVARVDIFYTRTDWIADEWHRKVCLSKVFKGNKSIYVEMIMTSWRLKKYQEERWARVCMNEHGYILKYLRTYSKTQNLNQCFSSLSSFYTYF